jgi:hypothetical protein
MSVPLQVLKIMGADEMVVEILFLLIYGILNISAEVAFRSNTEMISYLIAGKC